MNAKDFEQDELIKTNAERIMRNEEAIRRQTEALEKIRDHYFPKRTTWRRLCASVFKVVGIVAVYTGLVDTTEWYWNSRKSDAMADESAKAARRLLLRESDTVGAARFLEKAVEFDGGKVRYRIELAYVKGMDAIADLYDLGRPLTEAERRRVDGIMAEATFLQEVTSGEPMPYVLAAQALALRGEIDEATAAADKAVAIAPDVAPVRVTACAMRFQAGKIKEAREQIAEAERIDATLPLVHLWKAQFALIADHDPAAALKHCDEMLRLSPKLPLGHALKGTALAAGAKRDLAAARAEFSRALALYPQMTYSMVGISRVYELEGNLPVARLWLDHALETDANCMKALTARAALNEREGKWEAAAEDLTAAIRLAPFRADLYRERAKAHDGAKNPAAAKKDRETAEALHL